MSNRIRAAWNALRGRPTIAFANLTLAEPIDGKRAVIVGTRISRPARTGQ